MRICTSFIECHTGWHIFQQKVSNVPPVLCNAHHSFSALRTCCHKHSFELWCAKDHTKNLILILLSLLIQFQWMRWLGQIQSVCKFKLIFFFSIMLSGRHYFGACNAILNFIALLLFGVVVLYPAA